MEIAPGLHAFIWNDPRANNANTYLIEGAKRILIDPGHLHLFDHVRLGLSRLKRKPDEIDLVCITHAHVDHLEAAKLFGKGTLLAMSREAFQFLEGFGGADRYRPDFFLGEGSLQAGDVSLEVLLTPGHSPGSLSFYWPDRKALFTGDVIFDRSIGRTDLPGGSGRGLRESIERLAGLEVNYLLPGHGQPVTGRAAVQKNFRAVAEAWFSYLE